jgi:hypothetical protein
VWVLLDEGRVCCLVAGVVAVCGFGELVHAVGPNLLFYCRNTKFLSTGEFLLSLLRIQLSLAPLLSPDCFAFKAAVLQTSNMMVFHSESV